MSEYFSKPKPLTGDMKVELNVSNYAAKADLRNATGVYPLKVPKNNYSATLTKWPNECSFTN